jgi:3-deoxy-manno-octulosonate cytidylyltransferase (CMP-KDO synthetase)
MRVDIVIPARYASSRLHGKPLLKATGKYLVQHVYERALQAKCARNVLIATDDPRIQAAVVSFGGQCVMTRRDHPSGTDRIAEVARTLDSEIIINLQGDEPEIDPACLDLLPDLLTRNLKAAVATLAVPIHDAETWRNPNCVKVVCDDAGKALYFSRSPIPHVRDVDPNFRGPAKFLQHIGLYAYRRDFLLELAAQPPCALEQAEKLEQLRVLAMGRAIQVGVVAHAGRGVDTLEDYERFRQTLKRRNEKLQAA